MKLASGTMLAAALACAAGRPVEANTRGGRPTSSATAPPVTEGTLETRDGDRLIDVPLERTNVRIRASAHLARVEVEQVFVNPFDRKIEAIYLFPLPAGAAVDHLELEVGGRVIRGEIAEKSLARRTYVAARGRGHVAALLTQERPNLFTQHVANLEPRARVVVRLRYLETLAYRDQGHELVFPMVAPPRYVPERARSAGGAAVQPAVLPPGQRPATDIRLRVELDAGVPIRGLASPSHRLVTRRDASAPGRADVELAPGDTLPNRDFVLRWQVAGDAPQFAVLGHRGTDGAGSFLLVMQPPAAAAPATVTAREIVIALDTSSSMRGAPLAKAKAVTRALLGSLARDDTFQIVRFADAAGALGSRPLANTAKNVAWALTWVDALEAAGGTEMIEGVAAALDFPHDPARLRLVVFITDGYVGNEDEVLATVHQKLRASRLFSFGVGTAVNRYLLEELATFGRGEVQVVRPDEDTELAATVLRERLAHPVLTDVRLEWTGLQVSDVTPARIPDLFVGRPIALAGHYAVGGQGSLTVHGMAAGRAVRFTVPVTLPEKLDRPEVATLWARARIGELTRQEIRAPTDATRAEILRLALAHHLVTQYTSLVAVDDSRVTDGGAAAQVAVPVHVPEGLELRSRSAAVGYSGGVAGGVAGGIGGGGVELDLSSPAPASKSMEERGMSMEEGAMGNAPSSAAEPAPDPAHSSQRVADGRKEHLASPPPAEQGPESTSASSVSARRAALRRQADQRAPGLRAAAAAVVKKNPAGAGRYVLAVTVAADGGVAAVDVRTLPVGAADAAALLAAEVTKWKLDPPGVETSFVFPIVLKGP